MTDEKVVAQLVRKNLAGVGPEQASAIKVVSKDDPRTRETGARILQLPRELLPRVLRLERLMIGWSSCRLVEHLGILRCFKCCAFGHPVRRCEVERVVCLHCGESGPTSHNCGVRDGPPACGPCKKVGWPHDR